MKQIPLTQGKVTIIDDEDYELASLHKWYAHKGCNTFYARTNVYKEGKRTITSLHQLIMGTFPGKNVDHINGDGLDNRKENLRVCTTQENSRNSHYVKGSSVYKGISFNKKRQKWQASIKFNGTNKFLGYFAEEIMAAQAYDRAASEYFGEFAKLNFGRK